MDKRTIFFILGLTLIFYVWNQFTDYGRSPAQVGEIKPTIPIVYAPTGKAAAPLSTQDFQALHLIPLYTDIELTNLFTYGHREGDSILFVSHDKQLPKVLYIQSEEDSSFATIRLTQRIKPSEKGYPALYSVYPLSKVELPYIPDEGIYPITLVYFKDGQYFSIQGSISERKALTLEQRPPVNGMIFLNYQGILSPFAFFESSKGEFDYLSALPLFSDYIILELPETPELKKELAEQKYYVLENEYQQLVFTNLNGAIAEINLPLRSELNQKSIVRPIEFDRILQENYPSNAQFPLFPYFAPGSDQLVRPSIGGYTPLIRRTIIGASGAPSTRISAIHYMANVFEHNKPTESITYQLKRFEKNLIEFEMTMPERVVTKTYRLLENPDEAPYTIDFSISIKGKSGNFYLGFGIPEVELVSGAYAPTLAYTIVKNHSMSVESIKTPKGVSTFPNLAPNWVGNGNGFFGIICTPLTRPGPGFSVEAISGEIAPTRLTLIDAQYERFPAEKYPGYLATMPILSQPGTTSYRIFAGPYDKEIFKQIDQFYTDTENGKNPYFTLALNYQGFFSFVAQPFSRLLDLLLNFFHLITRSWFFSIILLTIAVKLMLFPLNNWSMRSQMKLATVGPKLKALEEKYKKDPQKLNAERLKLFKSEKVNPAGGCLPMIIQLPFLLGMFNLLKSSFALRGASFVNGWIDNLSAPDVLFSWEYPIPFFGNSFHLLPFILGATMFLSGKFAGANSNVPLSDEQRKQKTMMNVMTLVFTFAFYKFPSGLNIYWISSSILGIFQQIWLKKRMTASKPKSS